VDVEVQAMQRVVTPEYFEALRLRVVAGRTLTTADSAASQPMVVVNRSFARTYLGDRLAGAHIPAPKGGRAGLRFRNGEADWEVVGVVEDMRQDSVEAQLQPEIFMTFHQVHASSLGPFEPILVLRTASDPVALIGPLRAVVRDVAPSLALDSVMTMEERVATSLARPRTYALLFGGFAVCAITIAGVGLFGVLSYLVAARSREIGVRTALGAKKHNIMMLVLHQALAVAITGLMIGLGASFALRRYLVTLLYGVTPHDVISVVAVGVIVIGATAAASYVPARRATQVDPLIALRSE
jgi:putative ABC transport system permease protein